MQSQAYGTLLHRRRPLLDLHYAPEVPLQVLRDLERCARATGLPLHQLELLGQDERVARAYVAACDGGDAEAFFEAGVDWARLEASLAGRPPVLN